MYAMPEAVRPASSAGRLKCGDRDHGEDRTSASVLMSATASNCSNLIQSWLEVSDSPNGRTFGISHSENIARFQLLVVGLLFVSQNKFGHLVHRRTQNRRQ